MQSFINLEIKLLMAYLRIDWCIETKPSKIILKFVWGNHLNNSKAGEESLWAGFCLFCGLMLHLTWFPRRHLLPSDMWLDTGLFQSWNWSYTQGINHNILTTVAEFMILNLTIKLPYDLTQSIQPSYLVEIHSHVELWFWIPSAFSKYWQSFLEVKIIILGLNDRISILTTKIFWGYSLHWLQPQVNKKQLVKYCFQSKDVLIDETICSLWTISTK